MIVIPQTVIRELDGISKGRPVGPSAAGTAGAGAEGGASGPQQQQQQIETPTSAAAREANRRLLELTSPAARAAAAAGARPLAAWRLETLAEMAAVRQRGARKHKTTPRFPAASHPAQSSHLPPHTLKTLAGASVCGVSITCINRTMCCRRLPRRCHPAHGARDPSRGGAGVRPHKRRESERESALVVSSIDAFLASLFYRVVSRCNGNGNPVASRR